MFKKKEKTEKAPKNKKVRTMKVGTHKKSVLLLWAVLLASTSFGVYKNFTAIDTHTVHEKEIIQLRLNDTNGIENFVKNFAKAYYSWDTSKEAIEARTTEISKYLRVYDEKLCEAIKKLSERRRNVVLMFYFLELPDAEIAEILDISRNSVYRNRMCSLKLIRDMYEEEL